MKKTFDAETEMQFNEYREYMDTFIDSITSKLYHEGVIKEVEVEQIQEYLADPDNNNSVLSDLTEYLYITTGEIHMMFELLEALPSLNYKINSFEKPDNDDKHIATINRAMHKIKHKPLIRDVLKQTATTGTLVGMWLGNKNSIHPYIFDDPLKVFPSYRKNGDWVVYFDLSLLDEYKEHYRGIVLDNLKPYVTEEDYRNYTKSKDSKLQHVELPQNRTFVVHTHKLKRNQGLGTGWANSAMLDVFHKRQLKNVERAIANKIINAIAILTIGNAKDPKEFGNTKLSTGVKKKVFAGVKTALEKSTTEGIPVVALPEFASLEFPDVKTDGLDGKKFDHVNGDLHTSLGLSSAATSGTGSNHASAKINFEVLYKRIAVLLEQVDTDMMQKMVNLILPRNQSDNYYITYDKSQPLTTKEKIDVLLKLNDKGWSTKAVVDEIDGVDWGQMLEQTLYETEELELQARLVPYKTSHTTSSNDIDAGAPEKDDVTDEGASTRDSGKNDS